jgi:2-keto-4-pentenoate hydratase/2-oxohepta-3-ene-1,7-dioic acid hydratase in catechol pathway
VSALQLVTFDDGRGPRPGALVEGDRVVDLGDVASDALTVATDPDAQGSARALVAETGATVDRRAVRLLPPVVPGKILCLGYNYRGHVPAGADAAAPDPVHPDVFVKTPNVLIGADEPVVLPAASVDVDYEGEISVVIGRRAASVPVDEAMAHVAGYALFNDVSDRDWQGRSSQWELGKCFDGFGPLGPALVPAADVADPHDLLLEVVRDGVVTVSQSTSTLVFPIPFLVHHLSTVMTLEPGDVISTGSPQKTPDALAAHRSLAPGDAVTIRVDGLGELTTTFAAAPAATGGAR